MVNLQAQLAYLKEQAAQTCLNPSANENPNEKSTTAFLPQDLQGWFQQMENSNHQLGQDQFLPSNNNLSNISSSATTQCYGNNTTTLMDLNPVGNNYENSGMFMEESSSFSSFNEESSNSYDMQTINRRTWAFDQVEDLHSVAFGYS